MCDIMSGLCLGDGRVCYLAAAAAADDAAVCIPATTASTTAIAFY